MCLGRDTENGNFYFVENSYVNTIEELLLGIIIDNAFLFDLHLKKVCKKASQKTSSNLFQQII